MRFEINKTYANQLGQLFVCVSFKGSRIEFIELKTGRLISTWDGFYYGSYQGEHLPSINYIEAQTIARPNI